MLLSDNEIIEYGLDGMITPFTPEMVRTLTENDMLNSPLGLRSTPYNRRVISYGVGSHGYDIRLSRNDFRVFKNDPTMILDPKDFNPDCLESIPWRRDSNGEYFVMPPYSYGLGVSLEALDIPKNITVLCVGKSTYARTALVANVTPGESQWRGHLTLEFANPVGMQSKVYANEGIIQLLFLRGLECKTSYAQRHGKYQDQGEEVTLPRL